MDEFWMSLRQNMEKLLKSVNRLDDRHTEEGIEIGARWAREWCGKNMESWDRLQNLLNESAEQNDEIEKLRLENAKLRARELNGSLRTYDGVVPKLEAEIGRLRGALEKIRCESKWPRDIEIAEQALKETGGDDVTTDKTPIRSR